MYLPGSRLEVCGLLRSLEPVLSALKHDDDDCCVDHDNPSLNGGRTRTRNGQHPRGHYVVNYVLIAIVITATVLIAVLMR
jgi:hypothetical protein